MSTLNEVIAEIERAVGITTPSRAPAAESLARPVASLASRLGKGGDLGDAIDDAARRVARLTKNGGYLTAEQREQDRQEALAKRDARPAVENLTFAKAAPATGGRELPRIPFPRKRAVQFTAEVARALRVIKAGVIRQLKAGAAVAKADDDRRRDDDDSDEKKLLALLLLLRSKQSSPDAARIAGEIVALLDLSPIADLVGDENLPMAASDAALAALAALEITSAAEEGEAERAATAAEQGRLDELVSSDTAAPMSILNSTRAMLVAAITEALERGDDVEGAIAAITASPAFDPDRPAKIGDFEARRAVGLGAIAAWNVAESSGAVTLSKRWITHPESSDRCLTCIANEEQGAIPISQPFLSGDQTVPNHPRCVCDCVAVIGSIAASKGRRFNAAAA